MSNRGRFTLAPLGSTPALRLAILGLPHHLRDQPICEIQRGDDDRGWLVKTKVGNYVMLLPSGAMQTLPQHKIGPAAKAAGVVL